MEYTIKLPKLLDNDDAILAIFSKDGFIHISWKTLDGKILVFEDIWVLETDEGDEKRVNLIIYENTDEYLKDLKRVGWVKEEIQPYYFLKMANKLGITGEELKKKLFK